MNTLKKKLFALLAFVWAAAVASAQSVSTTITEVKDRIDEVGDVGETAYKIAATLAFIGVLIAFIRKAKR